MEDPDQDPEDLARQNGQRRIAFQIMPASAVRPGAAPGWQAAAAGLLFLFTAGTCLQLALVANVSLLPKVRARARASFGIDSPHPGRDEGLWAIREL